MFLSDLRIWEAKLFYILHRIFTKKGRNILSMSSSPKVSVFTASKNGGCFLVDTIESVLNQTFKDYEHVIVDGASTDNTLEILKRYKHIRWISEPDNSAVDGFHKAIRMCRGEYLFLCCVSDGFLDEKWFEICVDIMERDPDISMVYGFPQYMTEDGHLGRIAYNEFFDHPPAQKEAFLPFWLTTRFMFPEGNYCVRRNIYIECFPFPDSQDFFDKINPFTKFIYTFNTKGYLPFFVPVIANYGRMHTNQISQEWTKQLYETINLYVDYINDYGKQLLDGHVHHIFRNGNGEIIGEVTNQDLKNYRCLMKAYLKTYPLYFTKPGNSERTVLKVIEKIRSFVSSF